MKKLLPVLVLISFASVLVMPTIVLAQEEIPEPEITKVEDLLELVNRIVTYIFTFVLAVAAVFLMMAGFNFMTAGGDPMKLGKARSMLTNALIGIAIAIGVKGIMMIIAGLLGVTLPAFQF